MYKQHFGFTELPFSIVPNSRFLFQSQRHKEAITRLTAGLGEGGGFAMLTGEVGTGKTTVARAMLRTLEDNIQPGLILNPTFSNVELLEAICDEFSLEYPHEASLKQLSQTLHHFLLESYAAGRQTLLVIDEAQHLSAEVLEQLRLLTNLETESQKLLKVLLIGQPELQQKLQMPQLRQLAQRITGRYHLLPLNSEETAQYIAYRLEFAGGSRALFDKRSAKEIAQQTLGIPRLINLVCDAALKQAYSVGESSPSYATLQLACQEVMSFQTSYRPQQAQPRPRSQLSHYLLSLCAGGALAYAAYWFVPGLIAGQVLHYVEQQHPKEVASVVKQRVLPADLGQLLSRANDVEQGIGDLYKVWGYQATVLDKLCLMESESAFKCGQATATLEQLRSNNMPVLLTLTHSNMTSYAVLHHLDLNTAQLLIGGRNMELPIELLKELWQGDYRHIWRQYWSTALKPGMQGEAVLQLEHHLSVLLGQPSLNSNVYDSALEEKVKLFQRWQGLAVDGIAGKRTLERLESLIRENVPQLNQNKEAA